MATVSVTLKDGKELTYYMHDRLKKNLDEKIKPALQKKDKDRVLIIDGNEGSGKSTLALQIGKCVDSSLDLSRLVFNAEQFRNAIYKAKKEKIIVVIEFELMYKLVTIEELQRSMGVKIVDGANKISIINYFV